MLPKDAEQRRQQAAAEKQQRIDPHLVEKPQKQSVVPYSNAIFQGAAIEWLVSTDQVSVKIYLFRRYSHMDSLFKRYSTHRSKT